MEENKIPTATEFLRDHKETIPTEDILIEFAKMHVKAALEEISKEFNIDENGEEWGDDSSNRLDSIINSYDLENIK